MNILNNSINGSLNNSYSLWHKAYLLSKYLLFHFTVHRLLDTPVLLISQLNCTKYEMAIVLIFQISEFLSLLRSILFEMNQKYEENSKF